MGVYAINKLRPIHGGKERLTHLNSLPEQKISSMRSFTTNMNNHITLQTKGTSICLAIEESYIQIERVNT